jgi:myo-inositol 2-dehydrogenase / D-chiro-inositol 1-dehydrogenase
MARRISKIVTTRRSVIRTALLGGLLGGFPLRTAPAAVTKSRASVERLRIGAIGLRYQGTVITDKAREYGEIAALCDVDRHVREQARASFGSTPLIFEDYQELLARPDIDVVLIGTPDHWHARMLIDACRAGKHVYCEKPLTLTINEGKLIRNAVQQTGKIVQAGSWQRSDSRFRLALEMVRAGRIGALQKVDVVLGKNEHAGPFSPVPVPGHFNWNLWQGQTPDVPYLAERSHYTFRWWQEYSGGQMTDWGAHHLDIAQWAINADPTEIIGKAVYPPADGLSYNVPLDFSCLYRYPGGIEMTVTDTGRNGILFTGSEGRIFVNRSSLSGKPVEDLNQSPLRREQFQVYDFDNTERPERAGKLDAIVNHMGNFIDCVLHSRTTISDVESQHRSATTCHLGNISMKLGRPVRWDAAREDCVDDPEASSLLQRPQRSGFEVK